MYIFVLKHFFNTIVSGFKIIIKKVHMFQQVYNKFRLTLQCLNNLQLFFKIYIYIYIYIYAH